MTKQLRQTILPTHVLGAAGTAESDALGYFSLVAGSGITLTPASGNLTIAATGSGTVTSVGLSLPNVFTISGSPVTGSGSLTATLATQSANQVFVGPSTGANAAPTFRALLPDDIPALSTDKLTSGTLPSARGGTGQSTYTDGQLLIGRTSDNGLAKATLTAGTGISITNGSGAITIAATNSGAVTSVTGTAPVASSGGATPAISLASGYGDTQNPYASKTAAHVLAAPSGSAGVPTFQALAEAHIPTLTAAKISDFDTQVRTNRLDQLAQATQPVTFGSNVTASGYRLSAVTTSAATSLTLDSTHNGAILRFTASSAVTVTIPTGLGAAFSCSIIQEGTGQITITPDAGVTRNAFGGATKTAGQYAVATLIATASNTFILGGQVVV
jgi:hypothetical protein